MRAHGKMRYEADGDRRIAVTRLFDAPREEVFEAFTRPERLQRWLGVFGGTQMTTCEVDPRVGGRWRFAWTDVDGRRTGYRALCTEFSPPERVATTATFDEPWFDGEERATITFEEVGSRTLVTQRLRYDSTRARDEVMAGPALIGMALGFDKLDEYLAQPAENWMDAEAGVP